jgi:hypothetical protein
MERTAMERSVNTDPRSRCLPWPQEIAGVGFAKVCAAGNFPLALLKAKEAEAD